MLFNVFIFITNEMYKISRNIDFPKSFRFLISLGHSEIMITPLEHCEKFHKQSLKFSEKNLRSFETSSEHKPENTFHKSTWISNATVLESFSIICRKFRKALGTKTFAIFHFCFFCISLTGVVLK